MFVFHPIFPNPNLLFLANKNNTMSHSQNNENYYTNHNVASSIGSSLSRVSSSSPSSTPTDSESHVGHVVLQSNHTLTPSSSLQNNHVGSLGHVGHNNKIQSQSVHSSEHEEEKEIAPPIASRPERTKSIVSISLFNS